MYVDGGGGIVLVMDDFHVALFWEGENHAVQLRTYIRMSD